MRGNPESSVSGSLSLPRLISRVAHVDARIYCSAREHGYHSGKEPHSRCRGEGCAQDQQQICDPGRLGRYGGSSTIEFIDLVRVDHLHRICLLSFRSVYARRPWRASASVLGIREKRPSRCRSRHQTFIPAFVIERLIRMRRRHYHGSSFCRFLRDGIGHLLLHSRFAHLRAGSGAWRLSFALCVCLLIWACWVVHFLLRLSRRRGLSWRIGSLLHRSLRPHGAGVPIVIARLRIRQWQTREQPSPPHCDRRQGGPARSQRSFGLCGRDRLNGQCVRHLCHLVLGVFAGIAGFPVSHIRRSRERTISRNVLRIS